MNQRSLDNLKPFTGADDPRRQNGRKKGSVNRRTVIRELLSSEVEPNLLFNKETQARFKDMKNKSYLEAVTLTLLNQALNGEAQASNILLRELRDIERGEVTSFVEQPNIEITVVKSRDEIERLSALETRLKAKYGDDYEELAE